MKISIPFRKDESIIQLRGAWFSLFVSFLFVRLAILCYVKSVDPDQAPSFPVSDLVLHCLPKSYLWHARQYYVYTGG